MVGPEGQTLSNAFNRLSCPTSTNPRIESVGEFSRLSNPEIFQETGDDYTRVLVRSSRWRVVRCKDNLQFIIQRRRGGTRPRRWEAQAYVLDAKALGPVLHRRSLGIRSEDAAAISSGLFGYGLFRDASPLDQGVLP